MQSQHRLLVFFYLWSSLCSAQAVNSIAPSIDQQQPRFSTSVQMVMLQASVLTGKGSIVRGLRQSNFKVFEDTQQQTIKLFSNGDRAVAIGLIVDNSGSMRRKHAAVIAAAKAFARNSNPHDNLFVISFNDQVTVGLPSSQLSSANSRELERALPMSAGGGKTALYDALETGLSHIHDLKQDKKALILISDGGDNASKHTVAQIISDATNSDVVIYTIGLFGKDEDLTNPAFMKSISDVTGGETYLPARPSQAANNCKRIAQIIRTQYTLGYSPNNVESTGKFRTIHVTVSTRGRGALIARTRLGYMPQDTAAATSPQVK